MKNLFIGINVCFGVACGLMGIAFLLGAFSFAYGFTFGAVGVTALLVSAMCLWLACDCRDEARLQ